MITGGACALYLRERRRLAKLRRAHASLCRAAASLEHSATDAILTVDAKGLIRGYNPAALDLFGYPAEEVDGQAFVKLLGPHVVPQNLSHDGNAALHDAQGEARRKDGSIMPVKLRVALSKSDPPYVWIFVQDLTEKQRAAQLETENALLWPTFDEAGLVIAMVDRDGGIIRASHAATRLLDLTDLEMEGRPYWEVFERESRWVSAQVTFNQAKNKLGPSRVQTEWVRADGSPIPLDWLMLSPAWDGEGKLAHVVVTAALASAGSVSPASLDARRQMLRMVERVAGRIAGHFENLLSTINGYSELALHDLSPSSPLRKDVEQILQASERASETTRQLLGFSGSRLISTEPLDLNVLLERMKRNLHERLRQGIELRLHPGPVRVQGNRRAFEDALAVLAEYAAAGAPPRGLALATQPVRLERPLAALADDLPAGNYIKLSASLGRICEDEIAQHLLEPFGSPMRGARHSTVGLAVLSGLARSCSGGITIEHSPGERSSGGSTTLAIWLPAADVPAADSAAARESKSLARATP